MTKAKAGTKRLLEVGFSKIDITPAGPLEMGGYIGRKEPATGAHDPLFVKALFFQNEEACALLLSYDLLHLSSEWSRNTKKRLEEKLRIPADHILMAATHTHSGPAVFSPLQRSESIAAYEESLADKSNRAAEQAITSSQPSRLRANIAHTTGIVRNRRNPSEATSDLLSLVRAEDESGNLRGHVVSFSCHPTVMPPQNLEYSADLFGSAASSVERNARGTFCMMFNGAAGDLSTRFTRKEQTWNELDRLGQKLGRKIIQRGKTAFPLKSYQISVRSARMNIPFRPVPPVEEANGEYAKANMRYMADAALHSRRKNKLRISMAKVEGASAQLLVSKLGGWESLFGAAAADLDLQVIRVGDIIFCGLPGEFFGQRGNELCRSARPRTGFIVGYANGYCGYVVPPKEAQKGGYELMMSPLHPKEEPKIIRRIKLLIKEAARIPSGKALCMKRNM